MSALMESELPATEQVVMSNSELQRAILSAIAEFKATSVLENEALWKLLLIHLRSLLDAQAARAKVAP